ncbi:NUDIX domain-containing protein [Nonomuraea sp. GTA35]|uniref:NUDIX domain-containing protein n=1 Tax=Nonomuraea sp. GTA35 TaxID=1676746 RepID=UPI0035BEE664
MPYWVLSVGGVEDSDTSLEDALKRRLREEVGAEAALHALVHVLTTAGDRQFFFLARLPRYNLADRSEPELAGPGRGQYLPERIPLTEAGIGAITLQPPQIAAFLISALTADDGLFALSDLRLHDPTRADGSDPTSAPPALSVLARRHARHVQRRPDERFSRFDC